MLDLPARRRLGHACASVRAGSGFTLVELMVTVAVLAIIATIAYPSLTSVVNGNRLAGAANEMVGTLQMARMEAVRLNGTTVICRSTNGTTCAAGEVWNTWIILGDTDRDGAIDDVLRVGGVKEPIQVRVSSAIQNSRITFNSDGLARGAGGVLLKARLAACMPTTRPVENERRIDIASGSRFSTSAVNEGGACDAPANP